MPLSEKDLGLAKSISDPRYRAIIDVLAKARRDNGVSQTDLAHRLLRRQQFVYKYETGERRLDIVEFVDIARVLKIDFISLLSDLKTDTQP